MGSPGIIDCVAVVTNVLMVGACGFRCFLACTIGIIAIIVCAVGIGQSMCRVSSIEHLKYTSSTRVGELARTRV